MYHTSFCLFLQDDAKPQKTVNDFLTTTLSDKDEVMATYENVVKGFYGKFEEATIAKVLHA